MFQTEFNSETVFVLNDPWNGTSPFQADFSLLRDTQAGLTNREGRRPYSATLRVSLKYTTTVHSAALRKLQASLRTITTHPVIVPFWPSISRWQDQALAPIPGGLKIVWKEDWSQFEIYTSEEPVWPAADDYVAPALYGFLVPSEPSVRNTDCAVWNVEFTESSPADYALAPASFVAPAGPQPAAYSVAPRMLRFPPDFTALSEQISVAVRRDLFGFRRQQDQTFYPHTPARSQKASYTLTSSTAVAQFLRFFQDAAGPGTSFWASGSLQLARLTADAEASDTVLHVEDASALHVGDYISLCEFPNVIARKVIGKTDSTLTLDAAPGVLLSANDCLLLPLCLARLDKPTLRISWTSPQVATCEMSWTELPAELLPTSDETLGITLGKLPERVVLIQFTRDLRNGTTLNYYFTNYERDLVWDGHTWMSSSFSCGDITQSLNLEDDGVEITSFKFTGNPLIEDITKRAEAPLSVVIRFADFDGTAVSDPQIIFTGDAEAPSRQGNKIKVRCKFGPSLLDTQLPIFIRGPMCNHIRGSNADGSFLISAGCTLLRANWKFTALVAAPLSAAYPYTVYLIDLTRAVGPDPNYFTNWFAPGVIEWGAGANIQRRQIIGSSNPIAGSLTVTLHRYFTGVPLIGDSVVLYPGCDGVHTTCKAHSSGNPKGKFDNYLNFGGEPFTPIGNPSMVGQVSLGMHGGKK